MNVKKLTKVANYYDVKYGFRKKADVVSPGAKSKEFDGMGTTSGLPNERFVQQRIDAKKELELAKNKLEKEELTVKEGDLSAYKRISDLKKHIRALEDNYQAAVQAEAASRMGEERLLSPEEPGEGAYKDNLNERDSIGRVRSLFSPYATIAPVKKDDTKKPSAPAKPSAPKPSKPAPKKPEIPKAPEGPFAAQLSPKRDIGIKFTAIGDSINDLARLVTSPSSYDAAPSFARENINKVNYLASTIRQQVFNLNQDAMYLSPQEVQKVNDMLSLVAATPSLFAQGLNDLFRIPPGPYSVGQRQELYGKIMYTMSNQAQNMVNIKNQLIAQLLAS